MSNPVIVPIKHLPREPEKYLYGVVCHKATNEIRERFRIDTKTGEKEILFQSPEYKKLRKKLKLD